MDALGRLESVARPLLRDVDDALLTLGAPPGHPVWALLRRTGATPTEVVAFFVDAEPQRLRSAAGELRDRTGAYAATAIPTGVPWDGGAGEAYTARAHSLDVYLRSDMTGAMQATASYVEEIARWYERSRDGIARALAEVLGSAQAVTVRTHHAGHPASVGAAADIAAHVLSSAAAALDDGRGLAGGWSSRLAEVTFRAPVELGTRRFDAAIHLDH
jgi:hypothetical protein